MADVPERRLHLRLELDADDLDAMESALSSIGLDLLRDRREEREVTSGGYDSGWHLALTCNPDQTGDQYREQLFAWSAERRRQRDLATNTHDEES